MAIRFWVGGTASWDGTAGTKWATTSGGAGGAAVPTSADDVFFDAASGASTVTVAATANCANLDFTGFTGTFTGTQTVLCAGSLTLVAGMTLSGSLNFNFSATTTGKTITTAGKTLGNGVNFSGSGGGWTLQDNFNIGGNTITHTAGTLDTNGKTVTASGITSSGTTSRTLTLGASTLNLAGNTPINFSGSSLTLNANTSTITCSSSNFSFVGNGLTFATVSMNSVAFGLDISGANTFGTLSIAGSNSTQTRLFANQTVSGTLTITGTSASSRLFVKSDTVGTARTLSAAVVSLQDVDFSDITAAGAASPFTGTRLGDCKGNSGITFTVAANKYAVSVSGKNWDASNVWATSSGGATASNNFPLPQDTVVLDNSGFTANSQTFVTNGGFRIGTIDASALTRTGCQLTVSTGSPTYFGDITLVSGLTMPSGNPCTFAGRTTQTITSAGNSWQNFPTIDSPGGTVKLGDAFLATSTKTLTLTRGTLDMNGKALTTGSFTSSNSNTRAITSGGATLTLTGNATTIWSAATATNLTLSDALLVDCTYSGAVGGRIFDHGSTAGGTEANSPNVKVSAGTDSFTIQGGGTTGDLNFTGFAGTWAASSSNHFGSLTLSTGMAVTGAAVTMTLKATSGTKSITSNGKTIDRAVTFDGVGGTWQLADAMTLGSTRDATLTNGTLDINGKTLTVGGFVSSNSNVREIKSSAAGGKIATLNTTLDQSVFFFATNTNLTVTRNSWTMEVGGNTTNNRNFVGGSSKTWPALTFTNTTANGTLSISGTNTFKSIGVSTPPQSIKFTAGTTTTIETNGFPSGTPGNLVTITSITAANHNLSFSGSGVVACDYLSISRSQASPANTWYAGNSTDGGNNSGWIFAEAAVLTGNVITSSLGSVTSGFSIDVSATGTLGTSAIGSVTITGDANVSATGNVGTFTLNSVTEQWDSNVSTTGNVGTSATGTVSVFEGFGVSVNTTGVSATSAYNGAVTYTLTANITPVGVSATGGVGYALVWQRVDDSQTPGWTPVPASGGSWTPVDDAETPGWTIIP